MKQILKYLRTYLGEHFHIWLYLSVAIFLAGSIYGNYATGFYDEWLCGPDLHKIKVFFYHIGFYALPWIFVLLLQAAWTRRWKPLKQGGLWAAAALGIVAMAFTDWFPYHSDLAIELFPPGARVYGQKFLWNLKTSFFYFMPLAIWWWLVDRKHIRSLYGLTSKGFDSRPYLFMLLIVLPGIIIASFRQDFLHTYPTFVPRNEAEILGIPNVVLVGVYEFFYAADFTFVELFFRGFLVIGLARWLGKDAILPMVAMYCFLHFGKPWGETMSSCFGGFILGVIAYYSRSILGGVFIHIGVAMLMEAAAWAQIAEH